MPTLEQGRDGGADSERVPGGKVGSGHLGARPVDGDEGDATLGKVCVGGQVGQQIRVPTRDEDETVNPPLDKRTEVIELGGCPGGL